MNHLLLRTRNFSNKELKNIPIERNDVAVIYRMSSTTPTNKITKKKNIIEINSLEGCKISSNKLLMKRRFIHGKIRTPRYFTSKATMFDLKNQITYYLNTWKTNIICKRYNSSKGNGLFLITSIEDVDKFIQYVIECNPKKEFDINHWIFERYSTYSKEYRLHCTLNGCFYVCRKELLHNAEVKWHRHFMNSVWIEENNPEFDKPNNWNDIVKGCVDALKSVNLEIGAFDIKVQSGKNPKYLILEVNSAPGLGKVGVKAYTKELTKLINNKLNIND